VQGLVGPNGAGKSTAIREIVAALRGGRGGGGTAVRLEPAVTGARVVVLPQQGGGWPGCTVSETLCLAARAGGRSRREARAAAEEWSALLGLDDVSATLCESLSHGVRRRVELGRVLLLRPALLFCDEPLAGLDGADRELALQGLSAAAAAGVTLVVAEHDRASLARIATATTELRRLDVSGAQEAAPA
jgi:ABC-2 type transport system ATP-binding protein